MGSETLLPVPRELVRPVSDGSSELEERNCPVCESANRSGPLSTEENFSLVRCLSCGMLYTHKVRTLPDKVKHYEAMVQQRQDSTSELSPAHYGLANQIKSLRLYDVVLRFICRRFPTGDVHLVDVGCAGGLLLLAAQVIEDSYNCGRPPRFKVRGVAVDPREQLETERNVGCLVATPEQAGKAWVGWADVITVMNVLEHANLPLELVRSIHRILRPEGIFIVDVPNNYVLSLKSRALGRWPALDLGEHINHFVPGTLDRLLDRAGFHPVVRLPGPLGGGNSVGIPPTAKQLVRWCVARSLMLVTAGAMQVYPHMTMVYQKK